MGARQGTPARGPAAVGRYGSGVSSTGEPGSITTATCPGRGAAPLRRCTAGPGHGCQPDDRWAPDQQRTVNALRCVRGMAPINDQGLAMCQAPFRKPSPLLSPGAVSFLKV